MTAGSRDTIAALDVVAAVLGRGERFQRARFDVTDARDRASERKVRATFVPDL